MSTDSDPADSRRSERRPNYAVADVILVVIRVIGVFLAVAIGLVLALFATCIAINVMG